MWNRYINAVSLDEVIEALDQFKDKARIVAGATDLILEIERGVRKDIDVLIDISRIPGLDEIFLDETGQIHLGPMVTHNHCVASKLICENAFPLAKACWEVGSPQIRNRGTVAGNVITGSPANDTISPLMALGATVVLQSSQGSREVALATFYTGVRKTVMRPEEILVDIYFPSLKVNQKGTFIKFALRRAQAISLINVSIILTFQGNRIKDAAITLGAVAPTIIHALEAEKYLVGNELNIQTIQTTSELTMKAARPINDVRSSAVYRRTMVRVNTRKGLQSILDGNEKLGFPSEPILLWGNNRNLPSRLSAKELITSNTPIKTMVNGQVYISQGGQEKTLLRFLREDLNLVGSKEGCAEGECGACTVFLDGAAVMACMVPAPRASGAQIITIEGIGSEQTLHPVQQAFVAEGAVQCGYCTPGFVMSAVKLLEENPAPDRNQIQQAITGNLCRCTGYYKIVKAIENAAKGG